MSSYANLETERLIIRPWTLGKEDRDFFHFLMSDKTVRQFYVTCLSREQADIAIEKVVERFEQRGLDWRVACLKSDGRPIGFTGLAPVNFEARFCPAVETGWLYDPKYWGQGFATEAASELLRHGFESHDLSEIVAFAVHNNTPSLNVMKRIGMKPDQLFSHPAIPTTHNHLNPHQLYRISKSDWIEQRP